MRICRKYRLIPQNIMKIITIWHTVVGISGLGECGFAVCVVGMWRCRQALNRLKINRLLWRKTIWTKRTQRSCLVKLLTLIGYSSGLPDISEVSNACFNTNRFVPCEVGFHTTTTSTYTVVVVYHGFETFIKSSTIVRSTGVKLETFFSINNQLQTDRFAKIITRCKVRKSKRLRFEIEPD